MKPIWSSAATAEVIWSLEHALWSTRTLAMGAMTLFPVLLAAAYRLVTAAGLQAPINGFGFFSVVTATVSFSFVNPMLALFYSSGIVTDEVESGTLSYLITRPIRRAHLLMGKMAGSFLIQVLLFVPSLVLCFYIAVAPGGWRELGVRFPALAIDAGVAVLGIAAYSGLFAFFGTALRRPVLLGLIFVFGWQAAATYVPGFLRRLTVTHYLQSLLPHESFQGGLGALLGERASTAVSITVLLAFAAGAHALAILVFSRKEYMGRASG